MMGNCYAEAKCEARVMCDEWLLIDWLLPHIKWWHLSTLTHHISLRIRSSKSPRVHSGPLCNRFRTSDPQINVMGQSTEMSSLVSMLFRTFLNPLNFLIKIFNILVLISIMLNTAMNIVYSLLNYYSSIIHAVCFFLSECLFRKV